MGEIKAITTYYDGYPFRSRLEARWAVFFNEMGIEYEYELEGFILSDGTYYLPDFYLPDFHVFFEVKAKHLLGTKEGDEAIRKISDGEYTDSWAGLIAFGDPFDCQMFIYCQECDDSGGGSYDSGVQFTRTPWNNELCLVSINDTRARSFFTSWETPEKIPLCTLRREWMENGKLKEKLYSPTQFAYKMDIINAAEKARQARFEHGETPKGRTTK